MISYIHDNKFKKNKIEGIRIAISGEDVDKIYGKKIFESVYRWGPSEDREILPSVKAWCEAHKDQVRVASQYHLPWGYSLFYFSRKEIADEFQHQFLKV